MASSCDHVDHVRTQLPYALAVGLVGLVFGELATGLGLYPGWVGLVLGVVALALLLRFVGRPVPDYVPE
jgi:Na+/H+ antiporter NhaC